MEESDWRDQLSQDMRRDEGQPRCYTGRFVDFLQQENRLKDTPEGLHQHVGEIETYIRLHIQRYPISPDALIQQAPRYYRDGGLTSVRSRTDNAYRRFYAAYHEKI